MGCVSESFPLVTHPRGGKIPKFVVRFQLDIASTSELIRVIVSATYHILLKLPDGELGRACRKQVTTNNSCQHSRVAIIKRCNLE